MERQIEIVSRGRKIELNEFSRTIVTNTILALVGSLRDVDAQGEISIRVKPSEASGGRSS
jgi:hypothetical protein